MNIGLLTIFFLAQNPGLDIDVRGFLSRNEVLIVQFDVRGVPDGQAQLVGDGLRRCDVHGSTGRRTRHRKEVQPHLQFALFNVGIRRIEERSAFDVFSDQSGFLVNAVREHRQ